MMAWDQSGIRGRLAGTLEPVSRPEFADNDRCGLQTHAGNCPQQRTLVVQIGTVVDMLLDFFFEGIDLPFNFLK